MEGAGVPNRGILDGRAVEAEEKAGKGDAWEKEEGVPWTVGAKGEKRGRAEAVAAVVTDGGRVGGKFWLSLGCKRAAISSGRITSSSLLPSVENDDDDECADDGGLKGLLQSFKN